MSKENVNLSIFFKTFLNQFKNPASVIMLFCVFGFLILTLIKFMHWIEFLAIIMLVLFVITATTIREIKGKNS